MATTVNFPLSTYAAASSNVQAEVQKRAITDYITLIDPADSVFIESMGGLDSGAKKFRFVNFPQTKVEWIEDTREALTVGLNTQLASGDVTVVLLTASYNAVQVGQILMFGDAGKEKCFVTGVNSTGSTLTVTRAYGGTTAVTQTVALNSAMEIIGLARIEGAVSSQLGYTTRTTNHNFTQIVQREIKVSRSQNQISQYGIREEFDYQSNKAIPHLMRLLSKTVYHGVRSQGQNDTARSMGGLSTFVTSAGNVNSTTGAITQAKFENVLKSAYLNGGTPTKAFVSPTNMQTIKNLYDGQGNGMRYDTKEKAIGMTIEKIITPYGTIDLIMDRYCPDSTIYILDPEHVGFITYYPFTAEPLAKTGDFQLGEVVGEFTMCVRMDKAHAALLAIV